MIHVCTYFDGRYAPRALLMLRSLCEVLPDVEVIALGLDERALALASLAPAQVRFQGLPDLLDANTGLASARRSPGAERGWLMTIKPAWLTFVLTKLPPGEGLTYVDADMMFLDSPLAVLEAARAASICLSPQRFPAGPRAEAFWGRFNGGWLGVRHDATAIAFLEAWQRDCHGRMAPDYTNQKFLDGVPGRYPDVHILAHPGVNLAPWNAGGVAISERDERVIVDGQPLVAYHMAGLFPLGFGRCLTGLKRPVFKRVLRERVYLPYLRRLRAIAGEIGVPEQDALDRVQWPQGGLARWHHLLSLWVGWARGGAIRF